MKKTGPSSPFKKKLKPQQEKCCPTCLNVMAWIVDDRWACPKHGEPTRP